MHNALSLEFLTNHVIVVMLCYAVVKPFVTQSFVESIVAVWDILATVTVAGQTTIAARVRYS